VNAFVPGQKVLIADDEQDVCACLKKYLERRRLDVVCVYDGAEARRLIEEKPFDYLLLDCSMPNVTGLELIGLARQRNPNAKIVLISGYPSFSEETVQQFGADAFIHKPIQLAEIDQILTKGDPR